jgi:hypothetical protein
VRWSVDDVGRHREGRHGRSKSALDNGKKSSGKYFGNFFGWRHAGAPGSSSLQLRNSQRPGGRRGQGPVHMKQDGPPIQFLPMASGDHAEGEHRSFFHFVAEAEFTAAIAHIQSECPFREIPAVPAEAADLNRIFHVDARLVALFAPRFSRKLLQIGERLCHRFTFDF